MPQFQPVTRVPRTGSSANIVSRALAQHLATMTQGDLLTYAAMHELTGVDMQLRRDLLETARRIVRTQHNKEFDVQIDVGLVCLSEPEKVGLAGKRRASMHRHARKTGTILQHVQVDALTPLEKHCWLAEMSIAGAVLMTTDERTVRQLETQGTPQPVLIDPTAYAGLFKHV